MGIVLVEPFAVQDVFVSGVLPEDLGDGTVRFTGFVPQKSFSMDGTEYVVVSRIIRPVPSIITTIRETLKVLKISCCSGEWLTLRH